MIKTGRCDRCGLDSDELENWGVLGDRCPDCVKSLRNTYPDTPGGNGRDIKIERPSFWGGIASYDPQTGNMVIRSCPINQIYEVLNHEYTHFLLHRMFGLQCCYQLDNIDQVIEPYQDSLLDQPNQP